ncbi:MAG: hypothetical protein PWP23_3241 [Candidatus Sumerlaeota bacterium]|nr:hypothetical protein [Candidatus Sumerlaeota bacterium]
MLLWERPAIHTGGNRNQLTANTNYYMQATDPSGPVTYAFDTKGNMTQRRWNPDAADEWVHYWDYTWNEDDRLVGAYYRKLLDDEALADEAYFTFLYDVAGRRILKREGTKAAAGQRTRYFFNGLTEEIVKVSAPGAHADTAFQRLVKWGSASTSGGPKTEPGTSGPTGWQVEYDAARRNNIYFVEVASSASDGTLRTETGNGYDITGRRTFATWLHSPRWAASSFQVHLDTSAGRKALVYRPDLGSSTVSGNDYLVGLDGKAGDFNEGRWVRLERDFVADAQAAWPGCTVNRVTGIRLVADDDLKMDGLSFSNSLTVQRNVLQPGVIGHIVASRDTDTATSAETVRHPHYDQVGTVMGWSNAAGTSFAASHSDTWGNALASWTTGRWASADGWLHNTKETDGDLGLVYMYQRWYMPETGTFLSQDPISNLDRISRKEPSIGEYDFALGNPNQIADSTGMQPNPCKCQQAQNIFAGTDPLCAGLCGAACATSASPGSEGGFVAICMRRCQSSWDCAMGLAAFNVCIQKAAGNPAKTAKCAKHLAPCSKQ